MKYLTSQRALTSTSPYSSFCSLTLEVLGLRSFAFIDLNGKWHQRGKMGWFGCHSKEVEEQDWATEYWDDFNSLDDNVIASCYDCHI